MTEQTLAYTDASRRERKNLSPGIGSFSRLNDPIDQLRAIAQS